VSGWITPALAAAIWAGLLARPGIAGGEPAWWWFCPVSSLGVAVTVAPRPTRETGPLLRAGLVDRGPADVLDSVSPPAISSPSHGLASGALALAAAFLLAVGWGSAHEHRVRDALLARLAPAAVTAEGSLRIDPRREADRWSAILDVRSVSWDKPRRSRDRLARQQEYRHGRFAG
jgi:hypothetical protein